MIKPNQDTLRRQKMMKISALSLACIIPLGLALTWYVQYKKDSSNLKKFSENLNNYQTLMNDDGTTISQLQELKHSNALLDTSWINKLSVFQQHNLSAIGNKLYDKKVREVFMPYLKQQIEKGINSSKDMSSLYKSLRAYLMLGDKAHYNRQDLALWAETAWKNQFPGEQNKQEDYNQYTMILLQKPLPDTALNKSLITQARTKLDSITTPELAYLELQDSAYNQHKNNDDISRNIGNYGDVFVNNSPQVAWFNTQKGYAHFYFSENISTLKNIIGNNWVLDKKSNIKLTPKMISMMHDVYVNETAKSWNSVFNQIQIKPFASMQDGVDILDKAAKENSPLLLVMQEINSAVPSPDKKIFSSLYSLPLDKWSSPANYKPINKQLTATKTYLQKLNTSATNVDLMQKSAVDILNKDPSNPIVALYHQAKNYPQPIQRWMQSLAQQSAKVVFASARQGLNQMWKTSVYPAYSENLKGKYPIDQHASTEISVVTFSQFFSPESPAGKFLANNMSSLLDKSSSTWKWKSFAGMNIGLSNVTLQKMQHLSEIQQLLFNSGKLREGSFYIKPVYADYKVQKAILTMGDENILYRHDPQQYRKIAWPADINHQDVTLQITSNTKKITEVNASGPWALFKLMDKYAEQGSLKNGNILMKFFVNDQHVDYEVQTTGVTNPLGLMQVHKLNLPESLT